jgi:hypothetical protein
MTRDGLGLARGRERSRPSLYFLTDAIYLARYIVTAIRHRRPGDIIAAAILPCHLCQLGPACPGIFTFQEHCDLRIALP